MGSCQSTSAVGGIEQATKSEEIVGSFELKKNVAGKSIANGNNTKSPGNHFKDGDCSVHSTESAKTFGSTTETDHVKFGGSHASGASSTGDLAHADSGSVGSVGRGGNGNDKKNPKSLAHVSSIIGLESMIENRREGGGLTSNVVHMEVPFGKPIEEVYDGVHDGPVLGSGISGIVRLVKHKATGAEFAVKVLDLGMVDTPETLQQLREEIYIMCQLDHPNIVRLEEVYESHSEIYLVQELCLGGELFDRLDEQPDYHYTEAECARLVKQMLCAVRYLHSKGIIHRDLKLENFLFSSNAKDSDLKMIDFGLSKHFSYGEVQHEAVGTPYTVAPEVIRGSYDERCDIWAIGVITFLLLSGDPPFGGCGGPEPLLTVRSNILGGSFAFEPEDIWSLVSRRAKEFIRALLVTDPKRRPTAKEAQHHPWLKEWADRTRTEDDNVLSENVVNSLVAFKEFSDMRKLLYEVLSFTLLPEQIKDLRKEFEKMDTEGSGEISLSALKQVLMANAEAGSLGGLTEEEVGDIFNAMRVNKTETRIHWHEFIAAGLSQCEVDDRNLRLAFDRLDSDHKGYLTLDDILDLVGSDALHNEEMMRKMWKDSMKAVNCNHARITYSEFLLLMKGQTRECDGHEPLPVSTQLMQMNGSQTLHVVHEDVSTCSASKDTCDNSAVGNHEKVQAAKHECRPHGNKQAPVSIVDCKPSHEIKDHDEAAVKDAGDSVPLQPKEEDEVASPSAVELESLPVIEKPSRYTRQRSRSLGANKEDIELVQLVGAEENKKHAKFGADARRALLLPEHEHDKEFDAMVNDKNKTALQVNRQLYRAHRQMRLAVLEASKRFEEEQARHAKEELLARREGESSVVVQAGLVMRRGHSKQVSSEAISKLLEEKKNEQQALMEKANRRGGRGDRGRRNRKKTISDIGGMMGSLSQDELQPISVAAAAAAAAGDTDASAVGSKAENRAEMILQAAQPRGNANIPTVSKPQLRNATVPGEFKTVKDPFSSEGKYKTRAT